MLADLHLHSALSFDSDESNENYIICVQKYNEHVLGFSEHYDYDAILDRAENVQVADLKKYLNSVEQLKNKYPSVQILTGIEFGYRKDCVQHYKMLIEEYNFDYVINSVHTLPDRGDCFHDKFFAGKSIKESYTDYFNAVLESVYADFDYQIIGHIGYVSRYRTGDGVRIFYDDYKDILDKILKAIIECDKCLEINTSTGKSGSLFLPDTDVIKRYLELGGKKLSFGSDAHCAERYLLGGNALCSFLKENGVNELYYYKERKPISYKI